MQVGITGKCLDNSFGGIRGMYIMGILDHNSLYMAVKSISVSEIKNHFGKFLDTIQHEPVIITRNKRPIATLTTMGDEFENGPVIFGTTTYDELSVEAKEMYNAAINAPKSSFVNF